jgi:hypothetical protein
MIKAKTKDGVHYKISHKKKGKSLFEGFKKLKPWQKLMFGVGGVVIVWIIAKMVINSGKSGGGRSGTVVYMPSEGGVVQGGSGSTSSGGGYNTGFLEGFQMGAIRTTQEQEEARRQQEAQWQAAQWAAQYDQQTIYWEQQLAQQQQHRLADAARLEQELFNQGQQNASLWDMLNSTISELLGLQQQAANQPTTPPPNQWSSENIYVEGPHTYQTRYYDDGSVDIYKNNQLIPEESYRYIPDAAGSATLTNGRFWQ